MRRRSGGGMRCGGSLASSSEVRREGQTFAGESLLVRYADFVKLPHTIFALPFALLGVVVASYGAAVTGRTLGLVVLAFTCARFVALGFNRIADRALDARNPRTRARELPSGRLTLAQAWVAVVLAAALFLWAAWALNPLCFALAPVALVFISGYSYAKRFTHWSHLWLGLADGIATPAGYLAVTGRWSEPWWLLVVGALAVTFWVAGFDVFYALQDEDFDRAERLEALVVRMGQRRRSFTAKVLHGLARGALAGAGCGLRPGAGRPPLVRRGEIRLVHSLGGLQSAGRRRVGDAQPQDRRGGLRVARGDVQPDQVRRRRVGGARQARRCPLHHHHLASSRRLLDVQVGADALQHRGLDSLPAGPATGAGRRLSCGGHQALLLLLSARLAPPGLLAPRADGVGQRPPRSRRLEPLPRLHERAAHRAAHAVRRRRGDLVRRHVGQAGRGLAARLDLWADPPPPARGARHSQPPSTTALGRGRADLRARPPGRQHRGVQHDVRERRPAARDVAHYERLLGLQHHRQGLQVGARAGGLPGARGGERRESAAERRPAARRNHRPRVHGPARFPGRVAEHVRDSDLRHARRARPASQLGGDDAPWRHRVRPRARLVGPAARAAAARVAGTLGLPAASWGRGAGDRDGCGSDARAAPRECG